MILFSALFSNKLASLIYLLTISTDLCPVIAIIFLSLAPYLAVVVANPDLKLCPAYFSSSNPALAKYLLIINATFLSGIRIIIGPIIGLGLIKYLNLTGLPAGVLLIQSAMPSAILTYLVGSMYSEKRVVDSIASVIHTRSAEKETLEILKKFKKQKDFKVLIHCFTGTRDFAFKLLDLDSYISASGVITFKKSEELAMTFKEIPNEKILVETDAPYLAPVPLRGKPNEPSYIIHTIKFLSQLKELSFNEFSKITSNNFFKLFGQLN